MTLQRRPARRLTVFIGDCDTYRHRSLANEIVHRAHAAGLPGTSVFRGIEGFGARRFIHTTRILSLADELPIMLVIVGDLEAIDDFVPEIAPLLRQGLITIEDVETVYLARSVDQLNVEHAVAQ
jgi:PII-like signaling protein